MNADIQLDLEGEDLLWNRVVEIHATRITTRKQPLVEAVEERETLAEKLANANT